MTFARKNRRVAQAVWHTAITISLLATVMLVSARDLAAQRPNPPDYDLVDHPDFQGSWAVRIPGYDQKAQTAACGEIVNPLGSPSIRCGIPFNVIKPYLHPRELAWMQFRDERMSTKWYCTVPPVPVSLDGMVHTFRMVSAGELQIDHSYYSTTRHVWMDGRGHPPMAELSDRGHAIGWFEGKDLLIESTNFAFDPDGFEDHTHLASSFLKKVTERYKRVDDKHLLLTITLEDPLFLKRPFTYTRDMESVPTPAHEEYNCDPATAANELYLVAPDKYEGK